MVISVDSQADSADDIAGSLERRTYDELMDAATLGYNWAVENAPEDRGKLRQTSFAPERRGKTVVWGFTQPYAEAMEFGTDPFYPPLQPLLEWSRRVTGDEGLGYYVAREKIPNEGIDGNAFAQGGAERMRRRLAGEDFDDVVPELDT
jgi:hypothetical protein